MPHSPSDLILLERLFSQNYDMLYRLAYSRLSRYTCSAEDAADIVQQTFLLAIDKWEEVRRHPKIPGWLTETTIKLCCNHVRASFNAQIKARNAGAELIRQQPQAYGKLYTGAVDGDTEKQDILIVLERNLSEEDYGIVKSICLENRSYAEVSQQTGLSQEALRVRLYRIRKKISIFFILVVTILVSQNI